MLFVLVFVMELVELAGRVVREDHPPRRSNINSDTVRVAVRAPVCPQAL